MSQEWCPFARRVDGPEWKVGYSYPGEQSPKRGIVPHSAEGYLTGLLGALNGPKFKSWQFTITYDELLQHYPVSANCWHAGDVDDDGGVAANIDLVGIEHLGMAGEPLTQFQKEILAWLYDWLEDEHNFKPYSFMRTGMTTTVFEHKWVSDAPTSCPSYRIPHTEIIALLERGDHMPTPEYEELTKRIDGLQELARLGFNGLQSRIDTVEDGTMKVPIWPVGEVDLRTIRHHGYHAGAQVKKLQGFIGKLRDAMWEAKNALANHINIHNQSGGAQDSSSIPFIDDFSERLDEIEREVNSLGKTN